VALIHGYTILLVVGIEFETRRKECIGYVCAQSAKRSARGIGLAYDLEIDVFRHSLGELVCPAQGGPAPENEAKLAWIDGGDGGQSPNNMPILLDERRTW
jgi:hypothetical protein